MFQIFKITKLAWDARDGTCFLVVLTPKSMCFPCRVLILVSEIILAPAWVFESFTFETFTDASKGQRGRLFVSPKAISLPSAFSSQ